MNFDGQICSSTWPFLAESVPLFLPRVTFLNPHPEFARVNLTKTGAALPGSRGMCPIDSEVATVRKNASSTLKYSGSGHFIPKADGIYHLIAFNKRVVINVTYDRYMDLDVQH